MTDVRAGLAWPLLSKLVEGSSSGLVGGSKVDSLNRRRWLSLGSGFGVSAAPWRMQRSLLLGSGCDDLRRLTARTDDDSTHLHGLFSHSRRVVRPRRVSKLLSDTSTADSGLRSGTEATDSRWMTTWTVSLSTDEGSPATLKLLNTQTRQSAGRRTDLALTNLQTVPQDWIDGVTGGSTQRIQRRRRIRLEGPIRSCGWVLGRAHHFSRRGSKPSFETDVG